MKNLLLVFLVGGGSLCLAAEKAPGLPRSSPEAQGVSSAAVLAFIDAADRDIDAMNSVMLVRHGHVVAEGWWSPYNAASPHSLYSLSKSFTSTAVGLAVAEGKLSVDDPVLKFFPEDAPGDPEQEPEVDAGQRPAADVDRAPGRAAPAPRSTLDRSLPGPARAEQARHPLPLQHLGDVHALRRSCRRRPGMTVLDYLQPRLFEPLGIEHPTWEASPQGISAGRIRPEHPHRGHREVRPALPPEG